MKLYHLSPLWLDVIDPAYSQGKEKVVWVCKKSRLYWARAHLEKRHRTPMRCLHVVSVPKKMLRWRFDGVYTVAAELVPTSRIQIEENTNVG